MSFKLLVDRVLPHPPATERKLEQKGRGKEVHFVSLRLGNAAANRPFLPHGSHQVGVKQAQTIGVGSTGLDGLSASTHQVGKDVVVTNAVLFQLHNLKGTTAGYSSVTLTPTLMRALVTAAESTGHS